MELEKVLHKIYVQACEDDNYKNNRYIDQIDELGLEINSIITAFNELSDEDRKKGGIKITSGTEALLMSHAYKMSNYAINHPNEKNALKMAITALSIIAIHAFSPESKGLYYDYRDILIITSVIFDAASRIGIDIFSLASKGECDILKLRQFDARPPELKSIECMRYAVLYQDGKPYYKSVWNNYT